MDNVFRTLVDTKKSNIPITYNSKIVLIGSCFTQNIGQKLDEYKFDIDINPTGIVFNPISVQNSLNLIIDNKQIEEQYIENDKGRYFSYLHHSCFDNENKEDFIDNINSTINLSNKFLKKADFLFVSLGTAWVYRLIEKDYIVSNCHKQDSKKFKRELLSVDEIYNEYFILISELQSFNPNLNIVFTLSPIRHWKDGAYANQISKSSLLLAIDKLQNNFANTSYFPSYEIMMDDLRDYRFYADDMLHPSDVAINYIWDKFKDIYIDDNTQHIMDEVHKVYQFFAHKPFEAESETYKKQLKLAKERLVELKEKYPFLKRLKS